MFAPLLRGRFRQPGMLAMANSGMHSNGAQFFVTLRKTQWLNGRHVVRPPAGVL